jgi:hypothetical protein
MSVFAEFSSFAFVSLLGIFLLDAFQPFFRFFTKSGRGVDTAFKSTLLLICFSALDKRSTSTLAQSMCFSCIPGAVGFAKAIGAVANPLITNAEDSTPAIVLLNFTLLTLSGLFSELLT